MESSPPPLSSQSDEPYPQMESLCPSDILVAVKSSQLEWPILPSLPQQSSPEHQDKGDSFSYKPSSETKRSLGPSNEEKKLQTETFSPLLEKTSLPLPSLLPSPSSLPLPPSPPPPPPASSLPPPLSPPSPPPPSSPPSLPPPSSPPSLPPLSSPPPPPSPPTPLSPTPPPSPPSHPPPSSPPPPPRPPSSSPPPTERQTELALDGQKSHKKPQTPLLVIVEVEQHLMLSEKPQTSPLIIVVEIRRVSTVSMKHPERILGQEGTKTPPNQPLDSSQASLSFDSSSEPLEPILTQPQLMSSVHTQVEESSFLPHKRETPNSRSDNITNPNGLIQDLQAYED